jgi:hypothetical protein
MPRFRVVRVSHIGGRVYQVGDEVEYDGHPSSNLEPLDAAGEKAREEAEKHFARERDERLLAANPDAAAMGAYILRRSEGEKPEPVSRAPVASDKGGGQENPAVARDVRASAHAPATRETHK